MAAENNADQILVGSNGAVWVAPTGTTLPTDIDSSLDSAFKSLGYLSPQGPEISNGKTTNDIRAWQSFDPIATRVTEATLQVNFELMEWDSKTITLAFGGGSITTTANGHMFEPADPSVVDERCMIVEVNDGDYTTKFVFKRGFQAENLSARFSRTDPALLPVGFRVLAPDDGSRSYYILSDNPAFDSGVAGS